MAEIINLNKARKAREKAAAKAQAGANRTRFGRTKGQAAADRQAADKAARALDQAKREDREP